MPKRSGVSSTSLNAVYKANQHPQPSHLTHRDCYQQALFNTLIRLALQHQLLQRVSCRHERALKAGCCPLWLCCWWGMLSRPGLVSCRCSSGAAWACQAAAGGLPVPGRDGRLSQLLSLRALYSLTALAAACVQHLAVWLLQRALEAC